MSITKEVTIFCDGCGDWQKGSQTDVTAAFVRRECKQAGWVRCGLCDYCPACSNRAAPKTKKRKKAK